jgi:hypothetical protein
MMNKHGECEAVYLHTPYLLIAFWGYLVELTKGASPYTSFRQNLQKSQRSTAFL